MGITANFFQKLQPYQKVNQFPGITTITNKLHLARNLMNMAKAYPTPYDFFPKTWIIPTQMNDLRNHVSQNVYNTNQNKVTYIVKPDN